MRNGPASAHHPSVSCSSCSSCQKTSLAEAGRPAALCQPGCEALTQESQRLTHLRFDAFDADAQRGCDLGVLEAVDAAHLEYFAAAVREIGDGDTDCLADLLLLEEGVGAGGGNVGLPEKRLLSFSDAL